MFRRESGLNPSRIGCRLVSRLRRAMTAPSRWVTFVASLWDDRKMRGWSESRADGACRQVAWLLPLVNWGAGASTAPRRDDGNQRTKERIDRVAAAEGTRDPAGEKSSVCCPQPARGAGGGPGGSAAIPVPSLVVVTGRGIAADQPDSDSLTQEDVRRQKAHILLPIAHGHTVVADPQRLVADRGSSPIRKEIPPPSRRPPRAG